MSQMLKSSGAVAAATLSSRVLGLVREMAYAGFMGDTWVAGSFILAFMIPNLFRRLLGEGALTAAFVPHFKRTEKLAGNQAMWAAANAVISGLVLATAALTVAALVGVSLVLGAGQLSPKTMLLLELLRVMFPYLVLICLAAVFMGILNARGHFFVPALSPAILNLVMISSVFWLAPHMGKTLSSQIFGLAVGVVVAGVLQAAFQMPLLHREGFRYQWVRPWGNASVAYVTRQLIPGAIGVAAFQINVLLTQAIAYGLDPTVVASFYYAVRLLEFPQGVFGLSLATYLLPTLAGLAAEKKYPEFRQTVREGLGHLLVVNLLASILLVLLAEPIVRLLFERGQFDSSSTARASVALMWLAPGLVAYSVVNILARAFYAVEDLRTPMRISIFCLALNLLLVAGLVGQMRQAGLGLANSLSSLVNMGLLFYALRRKLRTLDLAPLRRSLPAIALAGAAAGLVARLTHWLWDSHLGRAGLVPQLGAVFVPSAFSVLVYFGLGTALGVTSMRQLLWLALGRARSPESVEGPRLED